jgi:basic membrane protein A and related proteins
MNVKRSIQQLTLTCIILIAFTLTSCGAQPVATEMPTTAPVPTAVPTTAPPVEPTAVPVEPLTIAFLTNGPVASTGWSYQLNLAAEAFKTKWGDRVKVLPIAENVPYSEVAAQTMQQFIDDGADVIIEGAYAVAFADPIIEANPDVKFIVFGTSLVKPPNAAWLWWNIGDVQYLLGMAAGLLTKTNDIGYVAPFDIPLIRPEINGYALGAQSVNSKAITHVVTLNSWYDPAGTRTATEALINSGIDVIGGDMDDPTKVAVANEHGVWSMGAYNNLQKQAGPETYVNTYIYDFDQMLTPIIQSILDGTWVGNGDLIYYEYGHGVSIGEWGANVPQNVIDQVNAASTKMASGEFNPFVGPLVDQQGKEVLAAGATFTPVQWSTGFDFILPGIVGIP